MLEFIFVNGLYNPFMTFETLLLLAYHFLINYTNINFNFVWIWITIMKSKLIIYSSHQSVVWLPKKQCFSASSDIQSITTTTPCPPLTTPTMPRTLGADTGPTLGPAYQNPQGGAQTQHIQGIPSDCSTQSRVSIVACCCCC